MRAVNSNIFQRYKQPGTFTKTNFQLYTALNQLSPKLNFIRSFTTTFFREISLSESSVPFSRRESLLGDDFGLKDRFRKLGNRTFNIFRYPIWHHFTSRDRHRNNFSKGRSYVQSTDFRPSPPSNEYEVYIQSL